MGLRPARAHASLGALAAPGILVLAILAVLGLLLAPYLGPAGRRLGVAAAVLGVAAALTGPVAFAADTITTPHTGSIVSAGPASATGGIGGAGAPGGGRAGAGAGFSGGPPSGGAGGPGGTTGTGTRPSAPSGSSALFGSGSGSTGQGAPTGTARSGSAAGGTPGAGAGGGSASTSAALVKALRSDASKYRWAAATSGSQSAATLELASDQAVMAIGGFNGQGGNLSLTAFERYVAKGEIHYWIGSGGATGGGPGGGPGGGGTSSEIAAWVKAHYKAETIGGQTVYLLSDPTS